jgi:putative tryptophan/tyrosine transport system substrate-binding protein
MLTMISESWRWLALVTTLGIAVLRPDVLLGQPSARIPSVGIIFAGSSADPFQAIRKQALRDAGFVEGQTIEVTWRFAEGRNERLPALASELVSRGVAAIVTFGGAATAAARRATTKIPIVAVGDDLVAEGHVPNLARPGGNVTGVSLLATELDLKRLELLKQVVPSLSRVVVFKDPTTPGSHLATLQAGGQAMGITPQTLKIKKVEDLDGAFQAARGWRAQGLNVLASPLLNGLRRTIIELAARYRLPAVHQWPDSVRDGGLMAYGPTQAGLYQLTFAQLDKVLKGAPPAELPIVQPAEFKLALNMRTAKALGLTISPSMVSRADQVIR